MKLNQNMCTKNCLNLTFTILKVIPPEDYSQFLFWSYSIKYENPDSQKALWAPEVLIRE